MIPIKRKSLIAPSTIPHRAERLFKMFGQENWSVKSRRLYNTKPLTRQHRKISGRKIRNIWDEYQWDIPDMLQRSRTVYLNMIKEAHPDKGGCKDRAAWIHGCWSRLKKLARARGYTI